MSNFPEIMIVRYYEGGIIEVTYSDDGSKENRDKVYRRLEKEHEEDKHLESSEVFFKGEDIVNEEEREKKITELNRNNV